MLAEDNETKERQVLIMLNTSNSWGWYNLSDRMFVRSKTKDFGVRHEPEKNLDVLSRIIKGTHEKFALAHLPSSVF